MKKNFIYALLGAIALTGAASLTACSSSDEIVDNPNYNPETNTVKTQLAITLPNLKEATTRMAEADVQGQTTPVFLGMQDIKLIAYKDGPVTTSSTFAKVIEIPATISANGGFTTSLKKETDNSQNQAQLYTDVEVPLETKGFLFYAQSQATRSSDAEKHQSGILTPPNSFETPSSVGFSLVSTQAKAPNTDDVGKAIAAYLTTIAKATDWSTAGASTDLGNLYASFIKLKAGSSVTALAAVQKLYTEVSAINSTVATNVKNAILNTTYASDSDADGILEFTAAVSGYPANIYLPDGAALLDFDSGTKTFTVASSGTFSTFNVGASESYVYPPSLYYMANSGIKTSNQLQSDQYTSANNWADILGHYTNGGEVTENTRSVALEKTIQYAVGRLDLTIKTAATLKDKYGVTVTPASSGFPVSAVMIANQKNVDFNFLPVAGSGEKTIYDTAVPSGMSATTNVSATNHTLALETEANAVVYVVVELTNNTGTPFQGVDGIVPINGKFYLLAKLDPNTITSTTTAGKVFKQDYITKVDLTIKENGEATGDNPKEDGLGGAYNLIPDFRTTDFELGLSVNLEWKQGLTFTLDI